MVSIQGCRLNTQPCSSQDSIPLPEPHTLSLVFLNWQRRSQDGFTDLAGESPFFPALSDPVQLQGEGLSLAPRAG